MTANSKSQDPIANLKGFWEDNENSIWLASIVGLNRNVEKFKFPTKLEPDRQKQIVALISKDLLTSSKLKKPKVVMTDEISPFQRELLMEHFMAPPSFYQAHSGEAFIFDETGNFFGALNVKDHIQLLLLDSKGELEETWNRLVGIETELGKQVSYAFSKKYGFLASDFNQCGTALTVSVFLQVPALVHSEMIDDTLEKLADESLYVTGIQANPTEIIGDIIVVQNNYSLGLSEENIIESLRTFTTKIMVEENSARRKILQQDNIEIKDKVSRAFGILLHSYQIEAVEALNALSLLKLGVELKWLTGMTLKQLNRLLFNCRRGHLLKQFGTTIKPEDLLHKRAEYIHQNLKNVQLVI